MPETARANVVSSFTVIKGSLIDESYTALAGWDLEATDEENIERIRTTNPIGAQSENWLRDVAWVFSRRFDVEGRDQPLAVLAQRGCPLDVWKPILLWHMTRDEFLVRDFLSRWLYERYAEGIYRIRSEDVLPYLEKLPERDVEMGDTWSESTSKRVASGLLRIAADFDLLRGTQVREFATYHLPDPSLLYLLHALSEEKPGASEMLAALDWQMYMMDREEVERELLRLHQFRALRYEVAGSLGQFDLPYASAEECAEQLQF